METKPKSIISHSIVYGLLTGAAVIVFSLVMFISDLYMNKAVSWISYLFIVGGMVYGTLEYRKKHGNGFLAYGKAFSSCFWIGLFGAILSAIYIYLFATLIHPGFIQELLDQSREAIVKSNPNMSDAQVEQALAISAKFMSPIMMMIWGFVANVVMGAILGLIIAIFLKKQDPSIQISE